VTRQRVQAEPQGYRASENAYGQLLGDFGVAFTLLLFTIIGNGYTTRSGRPTWLDIHSTPPSRSGRPA
jgi:hypothetical protein